MVHIDLDKELSIFLEEARPVLWNKTNYINKDRHETKKAWTEVCICLQEAFEAVDVNRTLIVNIGIIL
jgi:ribulose kinase